MARLFFYFFPFAESSVPLWQQKSALATIFPNLPSFLSFLFSSLVKFCKINKRLLIVYRNMYCIVRMSWHVYTYIGMNGKSTIYTFKTFFWTLESYFKYNQLEWCLNMTEVIMKFSCTLHKKFHCWCFTVYRVFITNVRWQILAPITNFM